MEESISSSRTTAFYGNSYYCNYRHQQQQPPAPVAAAATTRSDFEDADSGWTAYFLQLASDEEEEEDASAYNRAEKQQLRDVGGVLYGSGRGSAAGSTVSKPNKAKDNRQAVKTKVLLEKGVKKTRIVEEEEEDPLQDTASSPLVQLNINGEDPQQVWSTPAGVQQAGVSITSSRDRPPVQRGGAIDIVNGNARIETEKVGPSI